MMVILVLYIETEKLRFPFGDFISHELAMEYKTNYHFNIVHDI